MPQAAVLPSLASFIPPRSCHGHGLAYVGEHLRVEQLIPRYREEDQRRLTRSSSHCAASRSSRAASTPPIEAAVRRLVRAGACWRVRDEHFAMLLSPEWPGLQASVPDKGGSAAKSAIRQIERAQEDAVDPTLREMNVVTRDDAADTLPGVEPAAWIVGQLRARRPHNWPTSIGGGASGGRAHGAPLGDTSRAAPDSTCRTRRVTKRSGALKPPTGLSACMEVRVRLRPRLTSRPMSSGSGARASTGFVMPPRPRLQRRPPSIVARLIAWARRRCMAGP